MSQHDDFARSLARWFDAEARPAATADVLDRALSATRRRRPFPALLAGLGSHWVGDGAGPASGGGTVWRTSLRTSMAPLLLLLVLVLVAGAVLVGARLTQPAPVDLGIFEPVAGRIVFGDDDGIWAIDPAAPADSAGRVQLTAQAGIPLGWSSDGTRLLVVRQGRDQLHLLVLHADGSDAQVTTDSMPLLEHLRNATISPDGLRVVFPAGSRSAGGGCCDWALYEVDADGGPTEMLVESRMGVVGTPTFSPDGSQIAYVETAAADGDDGVESVWVMDADGSDAHQIVPDPGVGAVTGLAWSPAGDRIALGFAGAIYTFATDGSGLTQVIAEGDRPYWSPDGSQIAYRACASDVSCSLAIADADGSNVSTFGVGNSGPWHPATRGPSPRPSPAAAFPRFSSTIHGISIDYPSGWHVRPATESWNHEAFTFDAPGVDVIFDPTLQEDLYFSLASEPLGGQSAEDWWGSALAWAADEVCETGGTYGALSWDGWRGATRGCDRGADQVIAVATATHGYLIYLHVGDDPIRRARYDWNNFFGPLTVDTVELR